MDVWLRRYQRMVQGSLVGSIVFFFVSLLILWAPFALLFYGTGYVWGQTPLTNTLALIALYLCFIGNVWCWGRWGHGWRRPFETYGLVFSWSFLADTVFALVFGFGLVCLLFGVKLLAGWASFQFQPLLAIVLEGLAVGIGVGVAEELLFRGWLLTELKAKLSRSQAIVWSSVIFAIAHFIKPLSEVFRTSPQFFGLLLLGIILAAWRYVYRSTRPFASLGLPIGLHAGLVWGYYIVDVADLVMPSGRVPEWVTGIHGNPLSGILGLVILSSVVGLSLVKLGQTSKIHSK